MSAYVLSDLLKMQSFKNERISKGPERISVLVQHQQADQNQFLHTYLADDKAINGNLFTLAINNGGKLRTPPQLVKEGERWVLKTAP